LGKSGAVPGGRAGELLGETQPVQYRERMSVGVGVLDRETGQVLLHSLVEIEGKKNRAVTRISGESEPSRLLPGPTSQR